MADVRLPTRAYENGVYYIFSNAVGCDHDSIKPGNAMVLDPMGEIITESHALGDDVVVGLCTPEKIDLSSGRRYLRPVALIFMASWWNHYLLAYRQ